MVGTPGPVPARHPISVGPGAGRGDAEGGGDPKGLCGAIRAVGYEAEWGATGKRGMRGTARGRDVPGYPQ